jgi:hypothetical protein
VKEGTGERREAGKKGVRKKRDKRENVCLGLASKYVGEALHSGGHVTMLTSCFFMFLLPSFPDCDLHRGRPDLGRR